MTDKPKALAVTRQEGGYWEPFIVARRGAPFGGWKVHAVMFEDGSVWDAAGGWRTAPSMTPDAVRELWALGSKQIYEGSFPSSKASA